jgi:F-type H+-transporting ATPase subunit b
LAINYSLFIQIVNVLILLFILNIILYRPIRGILGQRKKEIDSFETMIGEFQEKSATRAEELEDSKVGARKEGFKAKEELKGVGLEQEKGMVQDALSSTMEKIDKAKLNIDDQMKNVRQSLENEVAVFSTELAEKILGRSV